MCPPGQDTSGGDTAVNGSLYIVCVGGQEQVCLESFQVGSDGRSAGQCGSGNIQAVLPNGIKYPETRIGIVSGHNNDFNQPVCLLCIQFKEGFDERKCGSFSEDLCFMFHLLFLVRFDSVFFEDPVFFFHIKQCSGTDTNDQWSC